MTKVILLLLFCVLTTLACNGTDASAPLQKEEKFDKTENAGVAFLMVTAAGMSTSIGAAMVFCDGWVAQTNKAMLGASLGFSAGVMLYVSFVEIFQKSVADFTDCECLWESSEGPEGPAYIMATICFFSGILLTILLGKLVHFLADRGGGHGHSHGPISSPQEDNEASSTLNELVVKPANEGQDNTCSVAAKKLKNADDKELNEMGIMTAVAIGLHNLPEGLATLVAALDDPAVGAALAVAIAIHNVPEGFCVSIPIYYATGSRWRGFWLAFFSGVAEIVGAGIGYGLLLNFMGPAAFAVLFGLVSGMMVAIVIREILPTAHRYDPKDKYATSMVFLGMVVMALSLVLFVA